MSFNQRRASPAARRLLAFAILFAACFTALKGYSFSALYAFGDSLSDTGRNPAPAPNYFNGRYSNGSLWVEYLSAQLGFAYNASNNFAVSASTTADLASQVAPVTASAALGTALCTVWSGGNDFLNNASLGPNDAAWNTVIMTALLNVTNAVNGLYAKGAREILVCNLPNIGQIPAAASLPAAYQNYLNSKVVSYNTLLASALHLILQRSPGLQLYPMDIYSLFNHFYTVPTDFGFTAVTIDALDDSTLADKSFTGLGKDYLFWDSIHPTTKTHAFIAAAAFQIVGVQLNFSKNSAGLSLMIGNLSPGLTYTIQTSPNLSAWTDYQTLVPATTNATVALTNGTGASVFYRVRY